MRWAIIVSVCPALLWPGLLSASEAIYRFAWEGEGGYSMQGAMAFKEGPVIVRRWDVTCFFIEGFHEGERIGGWNLSMLRPSTFWRLHFDALNGAFLVEGQGVAMPQAWNMAGDGSGCGQGGFGFNLGNIAQDICLNNEVVLASQKDPFAPFPAVRDQNYIFPGGACGAPLLLGALDEHR